MGYPNQKLGRPLGLNGLDGNENYLEVDPGSLAIAENVQYSSGVVERIDGLSSLDSTGVGSTNCLGGFDWWPTSSLQYQVTAWADGNLYRSSGSNLDATTLASSQGYTKSVNLVPGGRLQGGDDKELYIFSKNVKPQKVTGTGTSTANLTAEPSEWDPAYPGAATYHDGRIFAYDVDGYEDRFFVSSLKDHGDYSLPSGGTIGSVSKGQSGKITNILSYLGTSMLVFKARGIYEVDTTNVTGHLFPVRELRRDIGCAGPNAAVKVGQDVLFVSQAGRLYSLQNLGPERDPLDADITALYNLENFINETIDLNYIDQTYLIYNDDKKTLYYFFTSFSSSGNINDKALIFNWEDPERPRLSVDTRGTYFSAAWEFQDSSSAQDVYVAGSGGKIYSVSSSNKSIDGTGYTSIIRTAETDFSKDDPRLTGVTKRFDYIELYYLPTGTADVTITFLIDGKVSISRDLELGTESVALFDSAIWDTDIFATLRPLRKCVPINAWGETISFEISATGANEDFRLIKYDYMFKPIADKFEE